MVKLRDEKEIINCSGEVKNGNCLIYGRGVFINKKGISEYGIWRNDKFDKECANENLKILILRFFINLKMKIVHNI